MASQNVVFLVLAKSIYYKHNEYFRQGFGQIRIELIIPCNTKREGAHSLGIINLKMIYNLWKSAVVDMRTVVSVFTTVIKSKNVISVPTGS